MDSENTTSESRTLRTQKPKASASPIDNEVKSLDTETKVEEASDSQNEHNNDKAENRSKEIELI